MVDPFFTIFTGTTSDFELDRSPARIRFEERLFRHAVGAVLTGHVWGRPLLINQGGWAELLRHRSIIMDKVHGFGFVTASAGDDRDDSRERKTQLA